MRVVDANGVTLHVQVDGDPNGAPVVFANSLGTDLRLWDKLIPLMPKGYRLIRYDMRGHGLSQCSKEAYNIDALTSDAIAVIETLANGPVTFVGLSVGGMVGQNLASKRPDLLQALVLSNTAARLGDAKTWADRIAAINANGMAAIEDAVLDRWFGPAFRSTPEAALWGAMLTRTPTVGYTNCCAAIAAADLTDSTRTLRLPMLAIAGSHDKASEPDLVAATAALIPDAQFVVIDLAGHLPCVENPTAFAAILIPFLKEHANV